MEDSVGTEPPDSPNSPKPTVQISRCLGELKRTSSQAIRPGDQAASPCRAMQEGPMGSTTALRQPLIPTVGV